MPAPLRWINSPVKRLSDVVGATIGLLVLWPVMTVVGLIVWVRHGTPVLFRQLRAGRHGKPFRISKFRTMLDAKDEQGLPLPDQQRLTTLGRRLRSMSLDELPQLWSVLKGDMSLIGPRPLPVAYVERYSSEQCRRLEAKPGITGWAQVQGRNMLGWPQRFILDVWYVDNASFIVDARILVRTLWSGIKRDGVSAEGHATMPEFMGEC